MVHSWFEHNDKEISFRFFFEGDVVCSIDSFRQGTPSIYNIETIEPCILWEIGKEDFDKVVDEILPFMSICLIGQLKGNLPISGISFHC